jgi:hypothetical protein
MYNCQLGLLLLLGWVAHVQSGKNENVRNGVRRSSDFYWRHHNNGDNSGDNDDDDVVEKEEEEASEWLINYNIEASQQANIAVELYWAYSTNLTDYNRQQWVRILVRLIWPSLSVKKLQLISP